MTDSLLAFFQCLSHEGSSRTLVGIEPSQATSVEGNSILVGEYEVDANVFTDGMTQEEGAGDTPTEHVEASGPAREVVEREVGGRGGIVTDDDELAHTGGCRRGRLSLSIGVDELTVRLGDETPLDGGLDDGVELLGVYAVGADGHVTDFGAVDR